MSILKIARGAKIVCTLAEFKAMFGGTTDLIISSKVRIFILDDNATQEERQQAYEVVTT